MTGEVAPEGEVKAKANKDPEMDVPTDDMANGPVADRSCTDVLCCLIFLAFLTGMVGTAGYGYLYGDPNLLVTTWDADRNGCGYNKTTEDYPFLYFPVIDPKALSEADPSADPAGAVSQVLAFGTCVKKCPKTGASVECMPPTYMTTQQKNYKDCQFSFTDVNI